MGLLKMTNCYKLCHRLNMREKDDIQIERKYDHYFQDHEEKIKMLSVISKGGIQFFPNYGKVNR